MAHVTPTLVYGIYIMYCIVGLYRILYSYSIRSE